MRVGGGVGELCEGWGGGGGVGERQMATVPCIT